MMQFVAIHNIIQIYTLLFWMSNNIGRFLIGYFWKIKTNKFRPSNMLPLMLGILPLLKNIVSSSYNIICANYFSRTDKS